MGDDRAFKSGAAGATIDVAPIDAPSISAVDRMSSLTRVPSEILLLGKPLLGVLSVRFLIKHGIYVYEDDKRQVHVAVADAQTLPLVDTVAWSLQRDVIPELADIDEIMSALQRAGNEQSSSDNAMQTSSARTEGEDDSV